MAQVKTVGQAGVPEKGWVVQTNVAQPSGGSWVDHWKSHAGKPWPKQCSIALCPNPATAAIVVQNSTVPGSFVVPTCNFCVKRTGEVTLKPQTVLVSTR